MHQADLDRAVLSDPDSDAPRERYADWLAANGDPERAELIRLQLEEARTPPPADPDQPGEESEKRAARIFELVKAHPEWRAFPDLPGIMWGHGFNFGFERGFLGSVGVRGKEAFTAHMGRVFESAPVTTAVFERVDDAGVREIASSPHLARLRHVSFAFCPVGDAAAEAIASSPNVASLKSLRFFRCGVGPRGARALAGSPFLSASLDLDLRGNPIDAASARELRDRFGENVHVDAPEESGRNPLLGPFDEKLVTYFRTLTSALGETAPDDAKGIECTVRNLPGAPGGVHTRVVHLRGNKPSPVQVHPKVRDAANEVARFWTEEGGGFPGIRAAMTRQPDGTWRVQITRLSVPSA
jgi:uncharacterized protein (TIGR02996 family)